MEEYKMTLTPTNARNLRSLIGMSIQLLVDKAKKERSWEKVHEVASPHLPRLIASIQTALTYHDTFAEIAGMKTYAEVEKEFQVEGALADFIAAQEGGSNV